MRLLYAYYVYVGLEGNAKTTGYGGPSTCLIYIYEILWLIEFEKKTVFEYYLK